MTETKKQEEGDICAVLIFENEESLSASEEFLSLSVKKLQKSFPKAIIYSNHSYAKDNIYHLTLPPETEGGLGACLKKVQEKCINKEDSIALCYGWYPLLDLELVKEALDDHKRYIAHFTYGENIPIGLLPDFASYEFLCELSENIPNDLRSFVLKNIEQFDVEIFYKNPDLRPYRLCLSTEYSRSQKTISFIMEHKEDLKYSELENFIFDNAEILRPFPAYFEIELSSQCPLTPFYWPKREKAVTPHLSFALFQKLKIEIEACNLENSITVALGGVGEPMEHPQFMTILSSFLESKSVRRVYLESFGLRIDRAMIEQMNSLTGGHKLHIIFRLSSLQRKRYMQMYGQDVFPQVYENIQEIEKRTKDLVFHVYAEMLRIKENDDEIQSYFDRFEKSSITVILQKYNSYCNTLLERRAADLRPLHQDFCWHLARDFYLTVEGKVPLCKQDPFSLSSQCSSFAKESVVEIINKTMKYHRVSVQKQYDKIPMPCEKCDEWYTFNA